MEVPLTLHSMRFLRKGVKMEKQIDIFGNETNIAEIEKKEKLKRKRYITMQQMYGMKEGKKCGTCKHCIGYRQSKTWYKCKLWFISHSSATDIHLKDTACNKYESEE